MLSVSEQGLDLLRVDDQHSVRVIREALISEGSFETSLLLLHLCMLHTE